MVRSLILGFSSLVFVATARAELQLTPSISEYELDGVKLKELAFPDGDKKVLYQQPHGWEYSGSANQLTLRPPNKTQVEATITKTPMAEAGKFDDESVKKLVDEATAGVPKGSQDVTVVSQEKNPLMINRKETLLLILHYNLFGQSYNRSILFVNRDREQIHCQLTSRESDFKELQKAFLSSQFSWQNL